MHSGSLLVVGCLLIAPALGACASSAVDGSSPQMPKMSGLSIVSGDAQSEVAGGALAKPLVVRLQDASGNPVSGGTIWWQPLGGATLSALSDTTDAQGLASANVTLGVQGLEQRVAVYLQGVHSVYVEFSVQAVSFGATIIPTTNPNSPAWTWSSQMLPAIPSCPAAAWTRIWAATANELFTVGACGAIGHFTGSAWESQPSGTAQNLFDVWGRSAADVFAVGDNGTMLHYDGTIWSAVSGVPPGPLRAVWGDASGSLFLVVSSPGGGRIWHYDGVTWSAQFQTPCPIGRIWGNSPTDVYAAKPGLVHYDGTVWSGSCSLLAGSADVSGTDPGNVYTVGFDTDLSQCTRGGGCQEYSVVHHYDGTSWTPRLAILGLDLFDGVWVGGSDVVVVGSSGLILHFDGLRWRRETSGVSGTIVGITGGVSTSLWAFTDSGVVLHGTR